MGFEVRGLRFGKLKDVRWKRRILGVVVIIVFAVLPLCAQIENVPINNQVYEFLDRMAIKGILPLYSNTMIPISRQDAANFLLKIEEHREKLNGTETEYLAKFKQEFIHEINPSEERASVLFRDGLNGIFSDNEKYLYTFNDSTSSLYIEFLGTLEHRRITGDSYQSTHASFEQHGGRLRGTVKSKLGYFLQATNGALYGDKLFALSDPRLKGNVKFKDLNTPYFDFAEAYLRADLSWFNIQFGREYTLVGTGYSDRLLLSDNASLYDFLKLDAQYKSVKFQFLHASILQDAALAQGVLLQEPLNSNKYLALHRVQFSLFEKVNIGVSEMTIYQRYSPEFAYLNPIIFYKSVEHSLRDRDNSFLSFDLEVFLFPNYKVYGTWLIDDIDFSKIGTGWWGNEFGWQGGVYAAEVANICNLDAVVEYTRLEPYVYSNRVTGNNFTHNNMSLGHHLAPNSDELFVQLSYRPLKSLRTWLSYTSSRHGENIYDINGLLVKNVGGSVLQGHRSSDADNAPFLDGELITTNKLQLKAICEPIVNFFVSGIYELRTTTYSTTNTTATDNYGAIRAWVEY